MHGNARAEAEAQAASDLQTASLISGFGGLGVMLSGLVVLNVGVVHHEQAVSLTGLGLALVGLAANIASYPLQAEALGHHIDAINIYNDGASTCPVAPPAAGKAPRPPVMTP